MKIFLKVMAILCFAASACECTRSAGEYSEALASCRKAIPWVGEFDHLYPGANRFITHYNIKGTDRVWNSEAFLYDRYVVTMQIPDVKFDSADRNVIAWGQPKFFVYEITNVDISNGSTQYGQGVQFGLDQWGKLIKAAGDLTAVGIKVDRKSPVPHFETIKTANRG